MVHLGVKRHKNKIHQISEVLLRVFLLLLFVELERWTPFIRKIQPEEVWLYRNPMTDSYVPSNLLWTTVSLVPLAAILTMFATTRSVVDLTSASLVVTLALPLNGVITDLVKLCVGRPRPDFVYRCWPELGGQVPDGAFSGDNLKCSGDHDTIIEGRKSFPSGHSSFSFASWGFVFLYLSGKLGTFHCVRPVSSWRLLAPLLFLLTPLTIALSRTADYHHHWQDVLVGSMLGFSIIWMVYRQHYPPLNCPSSAKPLVLIENYTEYDKVDGKLQV